MNTQIKDARRLFEEIANARAPPWRNQVPSLGEVDNDDQATENPSPFDGWWHKGCLPAHVQDITTQAKAITTQDQAMTAQALD